MSHNNQKGSSRKDFLRKVGVGVVGAASFPFVVTAKRTSGDRPVEHLSSRQWGSSKEMVRFGLIGAGWQGQGDLSVALRHAGTQVTAACDLYESRLNKCRETWGSDLFVTRNYEEVLERDDVDAVIIATSDHWHERIAVAALEAGKAVYLEKPMVQHVEEGANILQASEKTGVPFQVGSQRTSSILFEKVRDLIQEGAIGTLNFVEGYWDRYSAIGAWQYSIPPSAGPDDIDWTRYREGLPQKPFDATEFFRWRNYNDYGTGVAGDLFVHLFSGLHMILGSKGPNTIMATGGLRYWHDGRDAEDVVLGLYEYPEAPTHPAFSMALRVNFADGSGGGSKTRLVGDEGEITINWSDVTLRKTELSERPGISTGSMGEAVREEYDAWYAEAYPESRAQIINPREFVYRAPDGYNDVYDHFGYLLKAIREGSPIVQDAHFGLRAAAPALLTSDALREKKIISWDPETMSIISS